MSNFHMSHYRRQIKEFQEEFGDFEGICLSSRNANLAELLNPLWSTVEYHIWIVDDFIWSFHEDPGGERQDQLRSQLIEIPHNYVTDTATLVHYADREVVNQGCRILGFAEIQDWELWMSEYGKLSSVAALRKVFDADVGLSMHCIDGSPWQVFSADAELVARLWDLWPDSQTAQLSDALLYSR